MPWISARRTQFFVSNWIQHERYGNAGSVHQASALSNTDCITTRSIIHVHLPFFSLIDSRKVTSMHAYLEMMSNEGIRHSLSFKKASGLGQRTINRIFSQANISRTHTRASLRSDEHLLNRLTFPFSSSSSSASLWGWSFHYWSTLFSRSSKDDPLQFLNALSRCVSQADRGESRDHEQHWSDRSG